MESQENLPSPEYPEYTLNIEEEGDEYHGYLLHFYFRGKSGNLLGYSKVSHRVETDGDISLLKINIIDTVSSYKLETHMKKHPDWISFFQEHGYTGEGYAGFGEVILTSVLQELKIHFPEKDTVIKMISYDETRVFIEALVDKVQQKTAGLIKDIHGGNTDYTCSFTI